MCSGSTSLADCKNWRIWASSHATGPDGIEVTGPKPGALRNGPGSDRRQRSNTLGGGAVEARILPINFLQREEPTSMSDTKLIEAVKALIKAAKPFLKDTVVTETSGTIPLIERLEEAIEEAQKRLDEVGL